MTDLDTPIIDAWMQHPSQTWLDDLDATTRRAFLHDNAIRAFQLDD